MIKNIFYKDTEYSHNVNKYNVKRIICYEVNFMLANGLCAVYELLQYHNIILST